MPEFCLTGHKLSSLFFKGIGHLNRKVTEKKILALHTAQLYLLFENLDKAVEEFHMEGNFSGFIFVVV